MLWVRPATTSKARSRLSRGCCWLFFITVGVGRTSRSCMARPVTVGITVADRHQGGDPTHRPGPDCGQDRRLRLPLAQAGAWLCPLSHAVSLAILPRALGQAFLLVIALSMLATPLLFIRRTISRAASPRNAPPTFPT